MASDLWYRHDMESLRDIMTTCIGANFGENPEERLDEIRESRYRHGKKVCRQLQITDQDTVADIGSGCGFVTKAACERAKEVHCIDISSKFLNFTKVELEDFTNTRFHHIEYAKFADIADGSIDKIFSTAVFIHFYYYDFLFYLIEINRILPTGGLFYTEIVDSDVLKIDTMAGIKNHVKTYKINIHGARLIQPFSLTALNNLAPQLGFSVEHTTHVRDVAEIVLKKTGPAITPDWWKDIEELEDLEELND